MKKITVRILASVICAIFAISIIFLISSVSSDQKSGAKDAEMNFESISVYTKSLCAFYEPESAEFLDAFKNRLSTESKYYQISLVCNGKEIFSQFITDAKPSFSSKEFSSDVSSRVGVTLTLKAAYSTVNNENIFKAAKTSFMLILTGTILAIVLLVLQNFLMIKNGEFDDDYDLNNIPDDDTIEIIDEDETETEETYETDEDTTETGYETETVASYSDDSSDDVVDLSDDEMAVFEEPEAEDETKKQKITDLEEAKKAALDFEVHLAEELANAAALDQDLSLVLLQCRDYLNAKPIFDNEVLNLKDKYPENRAEIFDFKNGFALILKSTDLDAALEVGEGIHARVRQTLKDYGVVSELATGISSRTERMITGNRLIAEAEQACEHGYEDPENAVVAFRVDPELYKKFLAEQGA